MWVHIMKDYNVKIDNYQTHLLVLIIGNIAYMV